MAAAPYNSGRRGKGSQQWRQWTEHKKGLIIRKHEGRGHNSVNNVSLYAVLSLRSETVGHRYGGIVEERKRKKEG